MTGRSGAAPTAGARARPEAGPTFVRLDASPPGGTPVPGGSIALVPGAEAPLLALDLPPGLRGQAREQVAWRQLRDRIGLAPGSVEMRPFAVPGQPDAWNCAVVVETGLAAQWRDRAGPACRAVLPDYLALPTAEGLWTVAAEAGGAVQVRLGPGDGFSADPDPARRMLGRALAETGHARPRAVLVLGAAPDWLAPLLEDSGIPLLQDADAVADLGIDPPRRLAHGETAADLKADPQAARARLRRRVLPWRWPLLIGLVAALLWGAAQMLATRRLDQAAAAVRAETEALVRAHFVASGPILDIRTQVDRALAARRAEAAEGAARVSPLALFGQAAEVIGASGARTEQIAYAAAAGLSARLWLTDFAAVDRLVLALEAAGIAVEVTRARVAEGAPGVRAELRLAAAGAADAAATEVRP